MSVITYDPVEVFSYFVFYVSKLQPLENLHNVPLICTFCEGNYGCCGSKTLCGILIGSLAVGGFG